MDKLKNGIYVQYYKMDYAANGLCCQKDYMYYHMGHTAKLILLYYKKNYTTHKIIVMLTGPV